MFERCIYFNVNKLARTINSIWDDAFQREGLSPAHAYLLRYVAANPGTTQKQIANDLQLDKSTVTRFYEALEKHGLLKRIQQSEDLRTFEIYPTKLGKEKAAILEKIADGLYQEMQLRIGSSNFKDFVSSVRTMVSTLSS